VKLPSVAVNYDRMEVSPNILIQKISVFNVPVNSGSLIGFEKRRDTDGVVVGLDYKVDGNLEEQDTLFDLPSPLLNPPPTEEVRLHGSFIIRIPLEYIKANHMHMPMISLTRSDVSAYSMYLLSTIN
jgi:hypothetical protein